MLVVPDPRQTLFELLEQGVADGVFPGCVALVWREGAVLYHEAHGRHATDARLPARDRIVARDTRYDLASLTKVLATTTMAAISVGQGRLELDATVPAPWSAACPGATLRDLLAHAAGLEAHREFFVQTPVGDREGLLRRLAQCPPVDRPGARARYSDLGFLILGAWLERVWDQRLDELFLRLLAPLLRDDGASVASLAYRPLDGGHLRRSDEKWITPTEVYDPALHPEGIPTWYPCRLGPDLAAHGVVHDDNAFVMGGVAGHAGLFGSAQAVLDVALAWLQGPLPGVPEALRDRFWRPGPVAGSTRRLGWDGTEPDGTGSTGRALSDAAVGHLGYTGCSLWIDPAPPRGAGEGRSVYVLLSNRVHPTRPPPGPIRDLRRAFHHLAAKL